MPSTEVVNDVWAKRRDNGPEVELIELPSGQTARVKRPGLEALMFSGKLLDLDSLTSLVDRQHIRKVKGGKGEDREEIDAASLMRDPENLMRVLKLADSLIPQVVVEPPVVLHWTTDADGVDTNLPEDARDPDVIYTDYVTYEDKMFLMQYALGGTREAERFRAESKIAVGNLATGEGIPMPAKRPRSRKPVKRGNPAVL